MKKKLYLAALIVIAMSSCKKDNSDAIVKLNEIKTEPSGYYKLGTVLSPTDGSIVLNTNDSKISYISRIPYVYIGTGTGTYCDGALGTYTKKMGEIARSRNGLFSVIYQADGNLVLYKRESPSGNIIPDALWATNAYELSPVIPVGWGLPAAVTVFQDDGNIVCKSDLGDIYWASNKLPGTGTRPIWILQNDGNFVGYRNWTSDTNGIVITGTPFAATFTDGGRKSSVFGKVGNAG